MRSTWRRPSVLLAAAATAALALGGCSDKTGGNATGGTPTQPGTSAAQQSATTAPASSAAPVNRPKTLNLQGVDPCSLIPDQLTQSLQMDLPKTAGTSTAVDKSPSCDASSSTTKLDIGVVLDVTQGRAAWEDKHGQGGGKVVSVKGYPATTRINDNPRLPGCFLDVDTADNQFLEAGIAYTGDGTPPPPAVDQLCATAQQVAETAVGVLTTR
jgi:hypothetical protein